MLSVTLPYKEYIQQHRVYAIGHARTLRDHRKSTRRFFHGPASAALCVLARIMSWPHDRHTPVIGTRLRAQVAVPIRQMCTA